MSKQASFNTPVLLIVFNRPDTTKKVFEKIRQIKPRQLFIASDGPRVLKGETEEKLVKETRSIIDNIDWDCQINTLFRKTNLGCGKGVSGAINWFFEHVESGIILEDDCLPSNSFFSYCEELLEYYKNETRVTHINGNNFGASKSLPSEWSYHFTVYPHVWGWATWKRAWEKYSFQINFDPKLKSIEYYRHLGWNKYEFDLQLNKWLSAGLKVDTWDYQWQFINQLNGNLAVSPKVNLISNIGPEGTHFRNSKNPALFLESQEILEPISHPDFFIRDPYIEEHYKSFMLKGYIKKYLKSKIKKVFKFLSK